MKTHRQTFLSCCLILATGPLFNWFAPKPSPPPQPSFGPGGQSYTHGSVRQTLFGEGPGQFWVYEPFKPAPPSAPVILFLHGWLITNPMHYGAWIDHLVRRGNIVIYPRYQKNMLTTAGNFTDNAISAVRMALHLLQSNGHVKPQLDNFAIVGHSAGAVIAANIGASGGMGGLPRPRALMLIEPSCKAGRMFVQFRDLSRVPKDALVLVVVGDMDFLTLDVGAKQIFRELTHIPRQNKGYIRLISDRYGSPNLIADHVSPFAWDSSYDNHEMIDAKYFPGAKTFSGPPDALDFYGYWKLFDGLTDAAFHGKHRRYALGDTAEQRFMGRWSDGTPVKELWVLENP